MSAPVLLPPLGRPFAPQTPTLADPGRDIRIGAIVAALFFVGFLGWAGFARLDSAAYATGTLTVSGQRQAVQHRDGGVVGRIYVREGQRVTQGQLLIQLAAPDVQAQERALASQAMRLLAQRARLEAEQLGRGTIATPREFADLAPEDRADAALAMRLQRTELTARTAVLAAQRGALGSGSRSRASRAAAMASRRPPRRSSSASSTRRSPR